MFLKPSDTLDTKRRNAVIITEASLATLSLVALDQLWYKDYPRSKFHTINDNNEWLQVDKFGHAFSSYQIGKFGAHALNWSGVSEKDQLIYGATLGFAFLGVVEVFDGFSEEWGFSWGDIAANAVGTGLYVGQELLWSEQRVIMKYSFHQTQYAQQSPDVLGNGLFQEFLKDYNGQTYWLSVNLYSFFKNSKIPKWLNLAFGYGAEGMVSDTSITTTNTFNINEPYRQFYFSLDIDLSKIQTNSHVLRTLFDVFNMIKVPFPAVEFTDKNDIILHGIYF
nr:YfiM family protein [Hanstruepera flava]